MSSLSQQNLKLQTPQEDTFISLFYISDHDFRSRGSQSWVDIAATMAEQALGYGIPILNPSTVARASETAVWAAGCGSDCEGYFR